VLSSFAKDKGIMQDVASVWSYGAPILNGGGLYFWFRNKQNTRFIAGLADVKTDGTPASPIDLTKFVAKNGREDFKTKEHAVVASVVSNGATGSGAVRGVLDKEGKLTLSISSFTGSIPTSGIVKVAYLVDTQPPTEAKPS
jgi:hypothetical protein